MPGIDEDNSQCGDDSDSEPNCIEGSLSSLKRVLESAQRSRHVAGASSCLSQSMLPAVPDDAGPIVQASSRGVDPSLMHVCLEVHAAVATLKSLSLAASIRKLRKNLDCAIEKSRKDSGMCAAAVDVGELLSYWLTFVNI